MKVLTVILVALLLAAPAAAKPDPQLVKLKHQVTALQAQVKSLQAAMTRDHQQMVCYHALHEDTFRIVFGALNQYALFLTGHTVPAWDAYLALPKFDDQGACLAAGIPRP